MGTFQQMIFTLFYCKTLANKLLIILYSIGSFDIKSHLVIAKKYPQFGQIFYKNLDILQRFLHNITKKVKMNYLSIYNVMNIKWITLFKNITYAMAAFISRYQTVF